MLENTSSLLNQINLNKLPKHIAIIMDGNGRWAKSKNLPRNYGHQEGMKRVIEIVETSSLMGINYLSLYAFSTENWKRPKSEVDGIMKILVIYIRKEIDRLIKNNIRLNILGDISKLPETPLKEVKTAIKLTANNSGMVLNIALNYGSRDEIVYGIHKILEDIHEGKIKKEEINNLTFKDYLYTAGQADPDLLIRPSGEERLSNFLLYQIAYSELYFTDVLWPDFGKEELYKAVLDFQGRDRRFGGI